MRVGNRPSELHMVAYQGDSFNMKLTLFQEEGVPLDLTGMGVAFSIAVTSGGRPAFKYDLDSGSVLVPDPTLGEIFIQVPPHETRKWRDILYVYDVTLGDDYNYGRTFLRGTVRVSREVVK